MIEMVKRLWHELNAFFSGLKLFLFGNKGERIAAGRYLFDFKFLRENRFIERVKRMKTEISETGKFKKLNIEGNIYYWPKEANMNSLYLVLGEALVKEHPHYYDSYPTALKSDDRVLDIGACEGAFCLHAAKKASKVVGVEPSYTMTEAVQLAASDMGISNLKMVSGLIGDSNGELGFQENILAPEASMILEKEKASDFRKCWTLDSFIEEFFPEGIDYIKCDAEGADFDILKSGRNSLLKYKPKISVAAYHTQYDYRNMEAYLQELGYTVSGQGLHYSPVLHKCFPVLLKAY